MAVLHVRARWGNCLQLGACTLSPRPWAVWPEQGWAECRTSEFQGCCIKVCDLGMLADHFLRQATGYEPWACLTFGWDGTAGSWHPVWAAPHRAERAAGDISVKVFHLAGAQLSKIPFGRHRIPLVPVVCTMPRWVTNILGQKIKMNKRAVVGPTCWSSASLATFAASKPMVGISLLFVGNV